MQAEAERLARESRTILGEMRRLELERDIQTERARQAAAAVADATRELQRASTRLTELERQRAEALPDLRDRLLQMYKHGRTGNVRMLLGAGSVRDFARATRTVAAMAAQNESRLAEHQRLLAEAQAERASREKALATLQSERRQIEASRRAAAAAVASRAAMLADIDRRRDLAAQLAGELQAAARRLDEQVTSVAAAAPPASPTAPVFQPRQPVRGGLEWPIVGRVIGRFGDPSPRSGGAVARNGIEIEAAEGSPVLAIHQGTVVYAAPLTGFGTLVIVDHGRAYHSVYGYLSSTTLSRGDVVDVGREVGRVGSTPGGPPAVYFEFRVDGRSVDPVQWLRPR
jgi:septal ring factor EnvC (AmiA/AmiB activator)